MYTGYKVHCIWLVYWKRNTLTSIFCLFSNWKFIHPVIIIVRSILFYVKTFIINISLGMGWTLAVSTSPSTNIIDQVEYWKKYTDSLKGFSHNDVEVCLQSILLMLTQVEYLSRDAWILFLCIYHCYKNGSNLIAWLIKFNYQQVWSIKMFMVF